MHLRMLQDIKVRDFSCRDIWVSDDRASRGAIFCAKGADYKYPFKEKMQQIAETIIY